MVVGVMLTVVIPLPLALPSFTVKVTVRLKSAPKSVGFAPALKVTLSSTLW